MDNTDGLKQDFIFASISLLFGGRILTHTVTLLSVFFFELFAAAPVDDVVDVFNEIGNEEDFVNFLSPPAPAVPPVVELLPYDIFYFNFSLLFISLSFLIRSS